MARGRGPVGELPSAGQPTRRAVLAGALAAGAGALGGCGGKSATPPPAPRSTDPPDPDIDLIRAVLAGKRELLARYAATVSRYPALSTGLAAARADHEGHIRTLAASPAAPPGAAEIGSASGAAGSDPTASPTPSGQAAPAVPVDRVAALRALAAAERNAAEVRLDQCVRAGGTELARLLASIGACEAAHGVVLGELAEGVSS